MQRKFTHTISWPGALSDATYTFYWKAPSDCTLIHVSATQSNATAASTWTLGEKSPTDDADGYVTDGTFGASGVSDVWDNGDFDGALVTGDFPRILADDVVVLTITGTAANQATDGTIVLTFAEG